MGVRVIGINMKGITFKIVSKIIKPFKGKGLSNTKIGKWIYLCLFIPNKPTFVNVEGFKLYIHQGKDLLSDRLLLTKEYEPVETKVIKGLVKEGDIIVDAGANIGYYTILLSRAVGSKGKVYAFEPGKECFDLLRRNVKLNRCYNVVLINKALSNKEGKIKFYINEQDKGSSSMLKDSLGTEVIVEGTTLDKEVTEPIDFMKMDIEGSELQALQGAITLLGSCKKIVMEAPEEREDFKEIMKLLVANRYRVKRLDVGNTLCTKKDKK